MDAVRGVDTLLETGGQVQGERKGTMRCHVVGHNILINGIITVFDVTIILIKLLSILPSRSSRSLSQSQIASLSVTFWITILSTFQPPPEAGWWKVQELAEPEIIPMPFVTENSRISLIVPVNEGSYISEEMFEYKSEDEGYLDNFSIAHFNEGDLRESLGLVKSFAKNCIEKGDRVFLMLVFLYRF